MTENNIVQLILGAIATNCWLIPLDASISPNHAGRMPETPRRPCAVIDPGEQADVIIAQMKRLNLYPEVILLTHGHFDHLAALPELAAAFPALEIAIHRDDASSLGPDAKAVHRKSFAAAGSAAYVDAIWRPLPSPTRLLAGGERIGPFKTLHLPGHTPGSTGFLLEDRGILFSGDTLFQADVGRTDLPGGDENRLQESLKTLFTLDPAIIVYPGHGPATSIGEEARYHGQAPQP